LSFLVVTLAIALGVALLSGGSLAHVLETRLRAMWALFLALALQVALDLFWSGPGNGMSRLLLALSYALLVGFCLANLANKGMAVVAFGIALNGLVIVANGGMPLRTDPGFGETVKHHAERPSDSLTALSDIIVLRPLNQALSFGDLIMLVGLVDVLVHRSRPAPTRRRPMALEAIEAPV
jgi:uncharacterized protein DUF5317